MAKVSAMEMASWKVLLSVLAVLSTLTSVRAVCIQNGLSHTEGSKWPMDMCTDCICRNNEAICQVNLACARLTSVCSANGKEYQTGDTWVEEMCASCECTKGGYKHCTIDLECRQQNFKQLMCFNPVDVNGVRMCPDGENCRYEDGTEIQMGATYHPEEGVTCQCSTTRVNTVHCHKGNQHDQPPSEHHDDAQVA